MEKLNGKCAEGAVRQRTEKAGWLFGPKQIGDDDAEAAFMERGGHGGDGGAWTDGGVEIRVAPIKRSEGGRFLFPNVRCMPYGE